VPLRGFLVRLNDGSSQLSSFGRRHHTIAMTVKQPAIAARNTKANERLLSAIFSPHDKAGILPPRCKTLKRIGADGVGKKRFVALNRVNGLARSLIPSSNCSFDANLPPGTLAVLLCADREKGKMSARLH
jgi:hypothetical protein